jgi:flagellin-like hook-associated protein FlgL
MTLNQNNQTSLTTTLANLKDVDVAKATVVFNENSDVYQAALEAAAKSITPTLADYLNT